MSSTEIEALSAMTADRALFFMERFLKEEKLLGPNEQAALRFVIDMLEPKRNEVAAPAGGAVVLTQDEVNQARELLYKCSGSAILSGTDKEARASFKDRILVYELISEALGLLIGELPTPTKSDALDAAPGWVMVPIEPTDAMKKAAVIFMNGNAVYKNVSAGVLDIEEQMYAEVYAAMLAANKEKRS